MELKTFDDVDHCRVSWGRVTAIDGPMLTVAVKPLIFNERSGFIFGPDVEKKIVRKLNDDIMIEAKIDDIISVHWDMPCEILTPRQVSNLEKYTKICVEQFRL